MTHKLPAAHTAIRLARVLAAATLLSSLSGEMANAATTTTSFTVSVTIVAGCSISAGNMNFGSQGVLSANVDSSSTISVVCTNTTPYSVGLDNGLNYAGGTRRMKDTGAGTTYVDFGLFTDAGRANAWTTSTAAGSCTGGANT